MRRIIVLILILGITCYATAQRFGGNPPGLRWKQLNTDTVRIIFPEGLDSQAIEIAGVVQALSHNSLPTIGNRTRKVDIVLQNQTMVANGYVALGPFRSEFFLTPRQNNFELGSLPWHKMLALHEYRHVQQFSNFRKGISKAAHFLFGEEGQALANSAAIPDWFWEGDAVHQETEFSPQGRGRLPYFFNPYRSIWASEKKYSWMKLRNGSYRDMVPDHYRLGYMLVDYGRKHFGSEVWKDITVDAAAFKGVFYPFQKAVRKHTGVPLRDFVNAALKEYNSTKPEKADSAAAFARNNRHFVGDEEFPQWTSDSTVVYVRSTFKQIPTFYHRNINSGEKVKLAKMNIAHDSYFSHRNGKIVYSSFKPDARWGWRNYGAITLFDIQSGKTKTLTRKTKYLSPDVSADGSAIVAVELSADGRNELHIIDAATGVVKQVIPNPLNLFFTQPKFYGNDTLVSAIRNTRGEMSIAKLNVNTGRPVLLVPYSYAVVGWPQVNGDTIAFTMSYEGRDKNFIACNGRVFLFEPQWRNTNTGDYQLSANGGRFAWSSFTAAGFHTVTGKGTFKEFVIPVADSNMRADITFSVAGNQYSVKPYSKLFQPFNFHSWRPYVADPEYSFAVVGENILNTLQSELFFTYNRNEQFKETGASFAYGGFWPVLRVGGSFAFDRSFSDTGRTITWNELNGNIGASVPLMFNSGTFMQNVNFAAGLNRRQVFYTGQSKQEFTDRQFNAADLSLSFTNQQIKALQNIHPRFAQALSVRHRFILNKYRAYQFTSSGALYLPGASVNHSIVLQGSFQFRDTLQQYNFSNTFSISRGYTDINFPRMWKAGINYHFPICYPDAGAANIVYLMRVRGNVFYDYAEIKSLRSGSRFPVRSTGLELYFDSKWWNQLPASIGIRYSHLIDNELFGIGVSKWEVILPLTLLSR